MPTAVIVDAIRTPLGKRNGKLKDWHPVDLAAETLKALVERNGIDPALVDDVVMGCVMQVGEQGVNIGRNAVLAAGWPETVPGTTVDRQCGSSQQAAHFAAQGVIAGAYDVVVAAGVEVMTRVPMGASMADGKFGFPFGPKVGARYADRRRPGAAGHLGRADRREVGHQPRGHRRLRRAQPAATPPGPRDEGRFEREIVPVLGAEGAADDRPTRASARHDGRDAGQRSSRRSSPTARSPPATRRRSPTAPPRVLIMSEEKADALGLTPAGPVRHTFALAGADPGMMLTGPIPATDEGARAGRHDARRHRPRRDQRGVRLGRAGVGEGAPPRHGARST